MTGAPALPSAGFLARANLDELIVALGAEGRRVIGQRVERGTVIYGDVTTPADLPIGQRSVQAPGSYRLGQSANGRAFDYGMAADTWKRFVYPPVLPQS